VLQSAGIKQELFIPAFVISCGVKTICLPGYDAFIKVIAILPPFQNFIIIFFLSQSLNIEKFSKEFH